MAITNNRSPDNKLIPDIKTPVQFARVVILFTSDWSPLFFVQVAYVSFMIHLIRIIHFNS